MQRIRTIRSIAGGLAGLLLAAGAHAACTGDCGDDGAVTVDEILVGVNIALGVLPAGDCTAMDADGNGSVTVDELVTALNGALGGCVAAPPTPTATPTATATEAVATPPPACSDSDGTVDVTARSASPASGNGPLEASCVTVENAGGTRTELTRVLVRGTVNGEAFRLQVYFVTATGAVDTVSYGWLADPSFPDFYGALAFCNTPACGGASVNLGTRTVTLAGVALGSDFGDAAVLDGTISLDEIPGPAATPTPSAACPGGSATLTFTDVQGTNSATPIPFRLVLGAAMNFSTPTRVSGSYEACPQVFPRFVLSLDFTVSSLEPGTSYDLAGAPGVLNQVEFREETFSRTRSWKAQSGTLVIDGADAGGTRYRLVGVTMRSNDLDTKGTFTLEVTGSLRP